MKLEQQFVDFKDRLARLEDKAQQGIDPFYFSNNLTRVQLDIGQKMDALSRRIKLLEQSNPPVPQSECEHTWIAGTANSYEWCTKCGMNRSKPTPSDEPKFNCVVCPECGLIGNYCEDKTRISISRKVAEEWLADTGGKCVRFTDEDMITELRRAIGK